METKSSSIENYCEICDKFYNPLEENYHEYEEELLIKSINEDNEIPVDNFIKYNSIDEALKYYISKNDQLIDNQTYCQICDKFYDNEVESHDDHKIIFYNSLESTDSTSLKNDNTLQNKFYNEHPPLPNPPPPPIEQQPPIEQPIEQQPPIEQPIEQPIEYDKEKFKELNKIKEEKNI